MQTPEQAERPNDRRKRVSWERDNPTSYAAYCDPGIALLVHFEHSTARWLTRVAHHGRLVYQAEFPARDPAIRAAERAAARTIRFLTLP